MPETIPNQAVLRPGDIYEDAFYHPCVCFGVELVDGAWGISLIDGSYPRSSDLLNSATVKLSLAEAWRWKMIGPDDSELLDIAAWWDSETYVAYDVLLQELSRRLPEIALKPGDLFQDSTFHPCLCLGVSRTAMAWGISLIDGSYPRRSDLRRHKIRQLTLGDAWRLKLHGPDGYRGEPERCWWSANTQREYIRSRDAVGNQLSSEEVKELEYLKTMREG